MASRHNGPRGNPARDGLRLRESVSPVNGGEIWPRGRRTCREMSALHRRIEAPTFLLRRCCRIFGTARKLLWCKGVVLLLLQRRAKLAGQPMPVLSEQIGPRARSVAGRFADRQHEVVIDACAGWADDRCDCRSTGSPHPRRSATAASLLKRP